ncbi:MAG TPA: EF-hand domain-containing protein, partial [Burkholderiales bacterium]|nr:EF-hand domain-containing protein [Burkholderiales bacterium]
GPPGKPVSGWRWAGIGAALIVLVVAASAWNEQRAAREQARQEAARLEAERAAAERRRIEEREAKLREAQQRAREREEALRRAEAERARERTAGVAPLVAGDPGQLPRPESWRERPTRERAERPGGTDPEEFRRRAEADFRSADANGDGYLTPDEVRGRMPLAAREFHRIDADGDGRISPREFMRFRRALHQQRFQK